MLEMNLGQIGTNEFVPYPSSRRKRKAPRPSRGDPIPPVFVMEAAENRASRDLAVLGEGMSIVTLHR